MDGSIEEKLSEIMSDPEAMEQVRSLGKMLGLETGQVQEVKPQSEASEFFNDEAIGKLTQLMPIISEARREDDTTRLLAALRPFLSEEKRKRLENAKKIIMMIKLFPALKDGGVLDIFSG